MQAENLTNTYAALLIISKSMFTHCFSYDALFHWAQIFTSAKFVQKKFSSINIIERGELHILRMCFPESELEVDNTKSIVLCE